MRFVVATQSFLALVKVNDQWKVSEFEVIATGHHYGIALPLSDGSQFIAKKTKWITTYAQGGADSDSSYKEVDSRVLGEDYGAVHQIAFYGGGLYVANTRFNSIDYRSLDGAYHQRYHFNRVQHDLNHVNSVFPCGANQVLTMLHNRGRCDSALVVMERNAERGFELVKYLPIWHGGCHNVFVDGPLFVYNASSAGEFVAVDLNAERIVRRIRFPGHTKGLSVTQDYFAVGFSDHAMREARKTSRGHLAIIDRKMLETVAIVDLNHASLPHPIGNVEEVRCLSEPEYGHARPTPLDIHWHQLELSAGDWRHQIRKRFRPITNRLYSVLHSLLGQRRSLEGS